jgi:hypothetical protein
MKVDNLETMERVHMNCSTMSESFGNSNCAIWVFQNPVSISRNSQEKKKKINIETHLRRPSESFGAQFQGRRRIRNAEGDGIHRWVEVAQHFFQPVRLERIEIEQ